MNEGKKENISSVLMYSYKTKPLKSKFLGSSDEAKVCIF